MVKKVEKIIRGRFLGIRNLPSRADLMSVENKMIVDSR